MTVTHPTLASLLEAIRADPDDDTPRLALADFLEESETDPAWAELIHVQVEWTRICADLDRLGNPDHGKTIRELAKRRHWLEVRESALRAEHEGRWRRGEKCREKCCVPSPRKDGIYRIYDSDGPDSRWVICSTCRGTGWSRWWLSHLVPITEGYISKAKGWTWAHPVHFERGLIVQVDANLADIFDGNRATEWALAVVRGEPGLRRLWPVDKRPAEDVASYINDAKGLSFDWGDEGQLGEGPNSLPSFLFHEVCKLSAGFSNLSWQSPFGPNFCEFDSAAAANRALAEAAWQVVSGQA